MLIIQFNLDCAPCHKREERLVSRHHAFNSERLSVYLLYHSWSNCTKLISNFALDHHPSLYNRLAQDSFPLLAMVKPLLWFFAHPDTATIWGLCIPNCWAYGSIWGMYQSFYSELLANGPAAREILRTDPVCIPRRTQNCDSRAQSRIS